MRSTTRLASIALAAALVVAACGSDETDTGVGGPSGTAAASDTSTPDTVVDTTIADTTPDTAAPTSAPEEPGQDVEADATAAQAALITVADLPAGWTESSRDGDIAATLDARLAECVGVEGDRIVAADATAQSARFVAAEGTLALTQDIGVLATERDARTVIAFTAEPGVPTCFADAYGELAADVLTGSLADGATIGAPVATRLQVGSAGDATQAIRVVVPVTGDPSVVEVTIDHVVVRSGRALADLTFENRAEVTPVETIDEITALVAERLTV
jgi:hypothetical protein